MAEGLVATGEAANAVAETAAGVAETPVLLVAGLSVLGTVVVGGVIYGVYRWWTSGKKEDKKD